MNMNQIKAIAAERGVRAGKLKKTDLIRAIQNAETNPECYMTGFVSDCGQEDCLWKEDCR